MPQRTGRRAAVLRRLFRWHGRSHPERRPAPIVSVAAALAIVGALASQPATSAHTHNPSDSTAFALASASDRLVDLVIATMEWDRTVGMLTLLQRDVANSSDQRSVEREGAFLGVDDGVGDDRPISVMALRVPAPRLETTALEDDQAPQRRAQQAAAEAMRRAERQAERQAERRAELQAERRAELQAERRAELQAERRAEREEQRRAAPAPAPTTSDWNNAPHVTWYGPGFYGSTTACGQRYTRQIIGVAHRTLPCGTMVEFRWKGITATAPVIDRGPYGPASYVFDFSAALSCDVFKPRGVANACFTRQDVAWRVVSRRD